jgi:hypothetical protein
MKPLPNEVMIDRGHPLAASLARLYLFNDGGLILQDLVLGATATYSTANAPTWIYGKFGRAAQSVAKATASDRGFPSGTGGKSVGFWMNSSIPGALQTIVSFGSQNPNQRINVYINTSGQISVDTWFTNTAATTNVCDSKWHHIVVTLDGTTTVYVDGVQDAQFAQTTDTGLNGEFAIGGESGATTRPYTGKIDYVSVYKRVLTVLEARQAYRDPFGIFLVRTRALGSVPSPRSRT